MTVAVLGGTGRTGYRVVELALQKGWKVQVLVRNANKFAMKHPDLHVVVGDATDASAVEAVLEGAEAVINAVGPVKGGNPELMTRLAPLVGQAVQQDLKRVVWLSGAGVKLEGDQPDAVRSLVRGIMKLVAGSVLRDSEEGVRTVLGWGKVTTVVRVPMLTDEPTRGELFLSDQPSRPVPVGRTEVAQLLVNQVEDGRWAGQAPFAGVR